MITRNLCFVFFLRFGFGLASNNKSPEYVYGHCLVEPNSVPAPGNDNVHGHIDFRQVEGDRTVEIKVSLGGFDTTDANTHHGFHVHMYGDLSGGCGTTAGHFNPKGRTHGAPTDNQRHVGDLGNIEEDSNGNVYTMMSDRLISLTSLSRGILGRAIVIHAAQDDLGTGTGQAEAGSLATGNAGPRLACCVIGEADGSRWQTPPA